MEFELKLLYYRCVVTSTAHFLYKKHSFRISSIFKIFVCHSIMMSVSKTLPEMMEQSISFNMTKRKC